MSGTGPQFHSHCQQWVCVAPDHLVPPPDSLARPPGQHARQRLQNKPNQSDIYTVHRWKITGQLKTMFMFTQGKECYREVYGTYIFNIFMEAFFRFLRNLTGHTPSTNTNSCHTGWAQFNIFSSNKKGQGNSHNKCMIIDLFITNITAFNPFLSVHHYSLNFVIRYSFSAA